MSDKKLDYPDFSAMQDEYVPSGPVASPGQAASPKKKISVTAQLVDDSDEEDEDKAKILQMLAPVGRFFRSIGSFFGRLGPVSGAAWGYLVAAGTSCFLASGAWVRSLLRRAPKTEETSAGSAHPEPIPEEKKLKHVMAGKGLPIPHQTVPAALPKTTSKGLVDDDFEDDEESGRLGWIVKIGAVAALLLVVVGAYFAYDRFLGRSGKPEVALKTAEENEMMQNGGSPAASDAPPIPSLPSPIEPMISGKDKTAEKTDKDKKTAKTETGKPKETPTGSLFDSIPAAPQPANAATESLFASPFDSPFGNPAAGSAPTSLGDLPSLDAAPKVTNKSETKAAVKTEPKPEKAVDKKPAVKKESEKKAVGAAVAAAAVGTAAVVAAKETAEKPKEIVADTLKETAQTGSALKSSVKEPPKSVTKKSEKKAEPPAKSPIVPEKTGLTGNPKESEPGTGNISLNEPFGKVPAAPDFGSPISDLPNPSSNAPAQESTSLFAGNTTPAVPPKESAKDGVAEILPGDLSAPATSLALPVAAKNKASLPVTSQPSASPLPPPNSLAVDSPLPPAVPSVAPLAAATPAAPTSSVPAPEAVVMAPLGGAKPPATSLPVAGYTEEVGKLLGAESGMDAAHESLPAAKATPAPRVGAEFAPQPMPQLPNQGANSTTNPAMPLRPRPVEAGPSAPTDPMLQSASRNAAMEASKMSALAISAPSPDHSGGSATFTPPNRLNQSPEAAASIPRQPMNALHEPSPTALQLGGGGPIPAMPTPLTAGAAGAADIPLANLLPHQADPDSIPAYETATPSPKYGAVHFPGGESFAPMQPSAEQQLSSSQQRSAAQWGSPGPAALPMSGTASQARNATSAYQAATPSATAPQPGSSYTVPSNETYWTISEQAYGSGLYYKALAAYNRNVVSDPRYLQGAKIEIPTRQQLEALYDRDGRSLSQASATAPTVSSGYASSGSSSGASLRTAATLSSGPNPTYYTSPSGDSPTQVPPGGMLYLVQEGEDLFSIAKNKLGNVAQYQEIYNLNRDKFGSDGRSLRAGTELVLPAPSQRTGLRSGSGLF